MKRTILCAMACLGLSLASCGDQAQESAQTTAKKPQVKSSAGSANPQSKPEPTAQQCVDTKGKPTYCPAYPGPWGPWGPY
jgi:hypothetical protein